jgi:Tetratricopeptide repeat
VSPQTNQDADLDRQIGEMDKAIRLNPRDAVAYRDRGYLQARKRNLDHALRDINQSLVLNQKDPRAYFLRGLIMHALKQDKDAIADLDRAIELDPEHVDLYRTRRDKIARSILPQQTDPRTSNVPNGSDTGSPKVLGGFFKRLAQYYAEFLSTDFKKQRLPRRRLQNSDVQGRLVGIPLRKYPGFQQKLWQELAKPIGTGLSLNVPRGVWRSALPQAVIDAIATHIAGVTQEQLDAVIDGVLDTTARMADRKGADPVVAFEQFIENIRAGFARIVIAPLLDRMEGFFARTENKPVESLNEFEDQLSTRLAHGVESASGGVFSIFLVDGNMNPLAAVLRDQMEVDLVREELKAFFSGFNAGDLYVELSDLVRSSRLIENTDFYLHIGEVHHANQVFPAFYIPLTTERTETGFNITS